MSERIVIDTRLTVEQNAAKYFERAKKAKRKLEGATRALERAERMLAQEALQEKKPVEQKVQRVVRKKEWFENFRWFISSDGFLCVGGRDANTNETIVKKHALPQDIVFHTDMAGSPFVVIKSDGKEIPRTTLDEAAQFTATSSRAWKAGVGYVEVFYVKPEQLSKTANSGEFMPKGAFMVRGSVQYLKPQLAVAIGKLSDGKIMAGPPTAVMKHCTKSYALLQGNEKSSDVAKRLSALLESTPDEIIPLLPAGGVKLGKEISTRSAAQGPR